MDFVDDEFIFVVKDEVWTGEECQVMKHNPLTLGFVYKYGIVVFLPALGDAADTSDFVFDVYNSEYSEHLYRSFEDDDDYGMAPYLVNSMNMVCARRHVRLPRGIPSTTSQYLVKQEQAPLIEEEFPCNPQGL